MATATQSMSDLLNIVKMNEDKLSETLATSATIIQVTIVLSYIWTSLTTFQMYQMLDGFQGQIESLNSKVHYVNTARI